MMFLDRQDAGRKLAPLLARYRSLSPLVLGLPRGGVPVAAEVAHALGAPLDVWMVRKLGVPSQPELAMGAIAEGGGLYVEPRVMRYARVSQEEVDAICRREEIELDRRVARYRAGHPPPDVRGKTVIVVDDGIATGATVRAALAAIRARGPERVIVAAPVAARDTVLALRSVADDVVCVHVPEDFDAVGVWFVDFGQTTDDDVVRILASEGASTVDPVAAAQPARDDDVAGEVTLPAGGVALQGILEIGPRAKGIVVFAHGSGSSRRSRRNLHVAASLQHAGWGTLLFDLLTEPEEVRDEATAELRFDIPLLADRLADAVRWLARREESRQLPLALFGASTGAAAALIAAANEPALVRAVISRGGRPDLAAGSLAAVQAPTLLIVGGEDHEVLALNESAYARLRCVKKLVIVPGATHLFEEPGALDSVAKLAAGWLERHLSWRDSSGEGAHAARPLG